MLFVVVCICTIGEIHCAGKGIYGLHAIIAEMVQQQTENTNLTIFDGNYTFRNLYQVSLVPKSSLLQVFGQLPV